MKMLAMLAGAVALAAGGAWMLDVQAAVGADRLPAVKHGVEKCVQAVLAKQPGDVLQAVLKTGREGVVWELEIETADGKLFDIECSAANGKIVETETRLKSADDPAFKTKMKVPEAEARNIALAKVAGKVQRVEYEIEADGSAVYELDIKAASGPDQRIEVDAATGKIVETSIEHVEIGRI